MFDILKGTIELGEKLVKALNFMKIKLAGNKSAALSDLNLALDEILKFYTATQDEISNFQAMDFSRGENSGVNKKTLFDIQSGMMSVRIADAKGSCSKIGRIYDTHLDTWFKSTFGSNSPEYLDIQDIFKQLSMYDFSMIDATKELSRYLDPKCDTLLKMTTGGDLTAAVSFHNETSDELMQVRKGMSRVATQMVELRNEFEAIAETTK